MMIIIIIGVLFLSSGLLTGVEFVALVKGVGVAFMASNAVERTIEGVVKKKEDMSED
jgi:ABC-type bacteriocin/lantibiotic exporter with double-glycine peptidase domain